MKYVIQTNLNPMDGDNWIYLKGEPVYSTKQEALDVMNAKYDPRDARVVEFTKVIETTL